MAETALCEFCQIGYHSPFERFDQIAVREDGPFLLQQCRNCQTLWNERVHDAAIVTPAQAAAIYPDFKP